ncbi:MAG: hypothetical protein ACE5F1_05035 [Planctomycetota bacterium]
MEHHNESLRESGNSIVMVLVVAMILGSFATTFLLQGIRDVQHTQVNRREITLLKEAENALHYNFLLLSGDPLYPVKDDAGFAANTEDSSYEGREIDFATDGARKTRIQLDFTYYNDKAPVLFSDRVDPKEEFNRIQVSVTARKSSSERQVVAWYGYELSKKFGGAIISDMIPTGQTGLSAKPQSMSGDIVLSGQGRNGQQYLYGDLKANGAVRYYQDKNSQTAILNGGNSAGYLGEFKGGVEQQLGGTTDEIPDFTALGGDDQLFDFPRFKAAALAGAGQVFSSLASFTTAMNKANDASAPLEGIIVLDLDSAAEGSSPKITVNASKGFYVPKGINIRGTLVFLFSQGTPAKYKVYIETALNLNAADLTGFDPADEGTYTTGYPATNLNDPQKYAWKAEITPAFSNFRKGDDLPALMFNTGIVDIHGAANVCGVVYGPSFTEIENKQGLTQYFNGSIIGGAGIYVEGHGSSGLQAIRYDPNTLSNLVTKDNKGKVLTRIGLAVSN